MLRFYQEKSWKLFFRSPLMAMILFLVILILMSAVYDRFVIERDMATRRNELEGDLQRLEVRKMQLKEQVDYLSHERGIEAEMRRNFDVAQAGEKVVIILDDETSDIQPLQPLEVINEVRSSPWYLFWNNF
jgi:cell division protein FtsB